MEVVISGISGKFPESDNVLELKENLYAGVDMVTDDDRRWAPGYKGLPKRNGKLNDLSKFDASYFGIHSKLADVMAPDLRILLESTYEAIVDAGMNPEEVRGSNFGVYIGQSSSDTAFMHSVKDDVPKYVHIGTSRAMVANRISFTFDFKGPSVNMDTACSSSLYALHHAFTALERGEIDGAIVGGCNTILQPANSFGFHKLNMLSVDGACKAFDASANGYVRSEGVGVLFLQRASDARRIYTTIGKTGANIDGYKERGITYPSGVSQRNLISKILDELKLDPNEISYVEAHGTGTKVGDPEELSSVCDNFCNGRTSPLLIGSIKSNLGHAEGAAAILSIIKVIIAMEEKRIPKNLHFKTPNPNIPALTDGRLRVVDENLPWTGRYAAVNSFGFGGANALVLLKSNPKEKKPMAEPHLPVLVVVSGRTKESVQVLLEQVKKHSSDPEFVALIHETYKLNIPGHVHRGFSIPKLDIEDTEETSEKRPLWFVFTGMGCQWIGMGKALMVIPPFAEGIRRCAKALRPNGVDLLSMINSTDENMFKVVLNSFVYIAAIQVALVLTLRELNVSPDGIIGHSVGELGCSLADEGLTPEQTVLAAYARGRAILDSNLKRGAMAAVGLSAGETSKLTPKGIYVVCHNSPESCTVSGPETAVENFVKGLKEKNIFCREVNSSGVAFHSEYIAEAGPRLKASLEKIIPHPKPRTSKWVSTSLPESEWSSQLASLCSTDYHVNNLLSPVYFEEGLAHIPENSCIVEIAPHALLSGLIKKAVKGSTVVGLMHKGATDQVQHLLTSLGKLYECGVGLDLRKLYPQVDFPVSRGTPMISPYIKWDHSTSWNVPHHSQAAVRDDNVFEFDTNSEDSPYKYLEGHVIDGRNIFPATGYITIVWQSFAKSIGAQYDEVGVVLEELHIHSAVILPNEGKTKLEVTIFSGSGQFEVRNGQTIVATGKIRLLTNEEPKCQLAETVINDEVLLSTEDIYKIFRLRGYEYRGEFVGITQSKLRGREGLLKWTGNWISFMDTMLQFKILSNIRRQLCLPTKIGRIEIDPVKQSKFDAEIPIQLDPFTGVLQCGGVQFRQMHFSLARRRQNAQIPKLEKYVFTPFNTQLSTVGEMLTVVTQLVTENTGALKLKIIEDGPLNLSEPLVKAIGEEPMLKASVTLVNGATCPEIEGVESSRKSLLEEIKGKWHLVLVQSSIVKRIEEEVKEKRFVLCVGPYSGGLRTASQFVVNSQIYNLLIRAPTWVPPKIVQISNDNFKWVEQLKSEIENGSRVVLTSENEPNSGIVGLTKCLSLEPDGSQIRCLFLPDSKFSMSEARSQLELDLVQNVRRGRVWGTMRHLPYTKEAFSKCQSEHAFINTLSIGDLSSLRWIQGPLSVRRKDDLIRVHFAALNFRDIMLATGKLPPDAIPGSVAMDDCILGMEYSGMDTKRRRVMGIVNARGLATTLKCNEDQKLQWEVPKQWSLKDAASVPIVYATAYYALITRGKLRKGEKVLIHAGSGGVGIAAISISLAMNCTVFTTVGTPAKRKFLLDHFPRLEEKNIGNSRDATFEQMVLHRTGGVGVDVVLNSLAGDLLKASVRCLADHGRFLEIGKVDLSNNSPLGMSVLLKNTTVHGILLDSLMETNGCVDDRAEVHSLVEQGLRTGVVKPLPVTVFQKDQIEESFRYMATGKHIGKVLIQIKGSEDEKLTKLECLQRSYFYAEKTYIIVGGMGGFGLELSEWLLSRGAQNLILVSRSSSRTGYQSYVLDCWARLGKNVVVSKRDVTKEEDAKLLMDEARKIGPVGGVFNLAAVLRDKYITSQTEEDFKVVTAAKVQGTLALDKATRGCTDLDHFVVFSSVSCGRGNPGQTNYGYANSAMERICEARAAVGLPALAIQWGAIGDVGLFVNNFRQDDIAPVAGTYPQKAVSCLHTLDMFLGQPEPVVSSIVLAQKSSASSAVTISLPEVIANILGIKDLTKVKPTMNLSELGMDSLMGTEIKQTLERSFDLVLTPLEIRNLTFTALNDMGGAGGTVVDDTDTEVILKFPLLPTAPIRALPSKNSTKNPVFMVHPIEGHTRMLEEISAGIEAPVWGLEHVPNTPCSSITELAHFYIEEMRKKQRKGPYTIMAYSLGTVIAIEMAASVQKTDSVTLILVDGSPEFVKGHTNNYMQSQKIGLDWTPFLLSYLAVLFTNSDWTATQKWMAGSTSAELFEVFSDRLKLSQDDLKKGVVLLKKKLLASANYHAGRMLEGPVVLFRASESFVDGIGEDYDLQRMCKSKLKIEKMNGTTHQTIIQGNSAATISAAINSLLK